VAESDLGETGGGFRGEEVHWQFRHCERSEAIQPADIGQR
jgi:hypothetical protein